METAGVVQVGGWLFRQRTWLPLPLVAALLLLPPQAVAQSYVWLGLGLVVIGEAIRLQGVRHIGVISRTRSERLGPLVDTGPFAHVRNPLYLGNILLWVGFAFSARLVWLAPIIAAVLFVEYHAIVAWEEQLLVSRVGDAYRAYAARVPRWIPRIGGASTPSGDRSLFSWRDALFSERGTLIAIVLGYVLLWMKTLI